MYVELVGPLIDAVHRAFIDTGAILHSNTWLSYDVRHSTSVSSQCEPRGTLSADVRHLNFLHCGSRRSEFRVAVGPAQPHAGDDTFYFGVRSPFPQHPPQVETARGEETGVQPAVRREAYPAAAPAEGAGDRGDHTDLAAPVLEAVAGGDLANIIRRHRFQGEDTA